MQIILYIHSIYTYFKHKNSTETLTTCERQFIEFRIVNRHDRNASQVTIDFSEKTLSASHLFFQRMDIRLGFVYKDNFISLRSVLLLKNIIPYLKFNSY